LRDSRESKTAGLLRYSSLQDRYRHRLSRRRHRHHSHYSHHNLQKEVNQMTCHSDNKNNHV
jgi:hypothetical protein